MFSSWAALIHLLALVWTDRNLRATSSTSHGGPVSCPGAAQEWHVRPGSDKPGITALHPFCPLPRPVAALLCVS